MAQPGAMTCARTMRQGLGRRMATPPRGPPLSPSLANEETIAVSRKKHLRSTMPQCSPSSASPGVVPVSRPQ
eukprot:5498126-Lingulodinium_polyedra.AAC.1